MAEFITTTLMDGYAGGPHITETQLGLANQATFGSDDYVLEGGRESEAQVLTNNSIRIFDAVYCIQGRRDVIPASGYTDVTIANGTQGMNRNDIIVRRYKKDESSEIESTEYAVIKGTPHAGTAVDPEVTTGDIRSGATLHEMALYRVKITGLNITAVEPMFNILKNMASLQKEFAELNSKSIIPQSGIDWIVERHGNYFEAYGVYSGYVSANKLYAIDVQLPFVVDELIVAFANPSYHAYYLNKWYINEVQTYSKSKLNLCFQTVNISSQTDFKFDLFIAGSYNFVQA